MTINVPPRGRQFLFLFQVRVRVGPRVLVVPIQRRSPPPSPLHIPVRVPRNREEVALHLQLPNATTREPHAYEGVRREVVRE